MLIWSSSSPSGTVRGFTGGFDGSEAIGSSVGPLTPPPSSPTLYR